MEILKLCCMSLAILIYISELYKFLITKLFCLALTDPKASSIYFADFDCVLLSLSRQCCNQGFFCKPTKIWKNLVGFTK